MQRLLEGISFIGSLASVPGGAALVLNQCRRSLHGLLGRIPVDISSVEEREKVARLYGTPFRDACELLLALMAVDPSDPAVAPLRTGSSSADGFAKLVRQIDARFASIGRHAALACSPRCERPQGAQSYVTGRLRVEHVPGRGRGREPGPRRRCRTRLTRSLVFDQMALPRLSGSSAETHPRRQRVGLGGQVRAGRRRRTRAARGEGAAPASG